jgi:hypothetical protein
VITAAVAAATTPWQCSSQARAPPGAEEIMLERTLIWLAFVLVVLALCWWKPNAARIFMGVFFIVMAVGVHIVLVLTAPATYLEWGSSALLAPYRWLFNTVVAWNPILFGLCAATFEITIALLMLSKGRWAQLGLVAGGLFLIAISPLGFDTLPNALLALGLFFLATKRYDASLWDMVASKLFGRSPAATV